MDWKINYRPISSLLPVEDVLDVHKWHKFITPNNDATLYSLQSKVYVTGNLEVVVHKSFVEAVWDVISRKAKRGSDYVIFSVLQDDGWYILARIDRNFISVEDVINE
jgi:hypothetical protein